MIIEVNVDAIGEGQASNCWVDSREVDKARAVLARACGVVVPVLFDDESPDLHVSIEGELNQVIDLQDRMDKGMVLIRESNDAISALFLTNQYMPAIYNAWSGKMAPDKAKFFLDNPINKTALAWLSRRTTLWTHWKSLAAECKVLAAGNAVWPSFFRLEEGTEDEIFDPIAHKRDCPHIDTRMLVSHEAYYVSHMEVLEAA